MILYKKRVKRQIIQQQIDYFEPIQQNQHPTPQNLQTKTPPKRHPPPNHLKNPETSTRKDHIK